MEMLDRGAYLGTAIDVGRPGRTRTDTPVKAPDFESGASTNFATGRELNRYWHMYPTIHVLWDTKRSTVKMISGRCSWIRTSDLLVPNQAD